MNRGESMKLVHYALGDDGGENHQNMVTRQTNVKDVVESICNQWF